MNLGEASDVLSDREHQLAAVADDPALQGWYEIESSEFPEVKEALYAQKLVSRLIADLGRLSTIKIEQASEQVEIDVPQPEAVVNDAELIEPDEPDEYIPSADELKVQRVQTRYTEALKQYECDMASITTQRRSKREHQEREARRNFARTFCDFTDVTGDKHSVLDPESILFVAYQVSDKRLLDEVVDSCVDYTERNGLEVTSDITRFGRIVAASVEESHDVVSTAEYYDKILRAIFSTRYNQQDFPEIVHNLAEASFDLLGNFPALHKIARMAFGKERFIPSSAIYTERMKKEVRSLFADGANPEEVFDAHQVHSILHNLNQDVLGANYTFDKAAGGGFFGPGDTLPRTQRLAPYVQIQRELGLSDEEMSARWANARKFLEISNVNDPVSLIRLDDGTPFDLGRQPVPPDVSTLVFNSKLFEKRMQQLAPYSYTSAATRKMFGDILIQSLSIPISPSVAFEIVTPHKLAYSTDRSELRSDHRNRPDKKIATMLLEAIHEFAPELMARHLDDKDEVVRAYEPGGELRMSYLPIQLPNGQTAVIFIRPCIKFDSLSSTPLSKLSENFFQAYNAAPFNMEDLDSQSEKIRRQLKEHQGRFLGRRPIRFPLPETNRSTGLEAVSLRIDESTSTIKAQLKLNDGSVDLEFDRNLRYIDEFTTDVRYTDEFGNDVLGPDAHNSLRTYYENLILKLVRHWACAPVVQTSEGVVNEERGVSTNFGHFGYLRVQNGRPYKFSDKQAAAFEREQPQRRTTLAQEDQHRLAEIKAIDRATGIRRHITYYKEKYNPNKPALEVYCKADDLED